MGILSKLKKMAPKSADVVCKKCGKSRKAAINMPNTMVAICDSGHFICIKCGKKGLFRSMAGDLVPGSELKEAFDDARGKLNSEWNKKCPICQDRLRIVKEEDIPA